MDSFRHNDEKKRGKKDKRRPVPTRELLKMLSLIGEEVGNVNKEKGKQKGSDVLKFSS